VSRLRYQGALSPAWVGLAGKCNEQSGIGSKSFRVDLPLKSRTRPGWGLCARDQSGHVFFCPFTADLREDCLSPERRSCEVEFRPAG